VEWQNAASALTGRKITPLCTVESHVQNDPKNNITCTVIIYAAIEGETCCNGEVLQPYFEVTLLATLGSFWFHQEGRTSTFGHNHSSMVKYQEYQERLSFTVDL